MDNIKSLRPIGRTGIMVTPIGLGCWQFSKRSNMAGKFWPTLEDDLIEKVVAQSTLKAELTGLILLKYMATVPQKKLFPKRSRQQGKSQVK